MSTDFPRIEGHGPTSKKVPSAPLGMPPAVFLPPGSPLPVKRKKTTAQKLREKKQQNNASKEDIHALSTQPVNHSLRLPELIDESPQVHEEPDIVEVEEDFTDITANVSEPISDIPDIDSEILLDIEPFNENDGITSKTDTFSDPDVISEPEEIAELGEIIEPEEISAPDTPEKHAEIPEPASDAQTYHDALHGLRFKTDLSNCLVPLLEAIGWHGHPRHVAEAIPHFIDNLDITSFRNIMANLRYESWPINISLHKLDTRLMPCLFVPKNGDAYLVESIDDKTVHIFNGGTEKHEDIPIDKQEGVAYVFKKIETGINQTIKTKLGWFRAVIERFRGLTYQVLVLTLILNLLALSTPLFVMAVYDKVVASRSMETLTYFAVGVSLALICDMVLRAIRSRILAFIGARLDNIVGNAVFQRIMLLPPALTERSTVGSQVARIKDFENVREFFTGQVALTFIELPFSIIFVIVIGILGGPVAFVPLVMVALFVILGMVMTPLIQQSVSKASRGSSKRQELVVETLGDMRAVKEAGGEDTWLERYRENSALASLNSFHTSLYGSFVQTLSSIMMTAAGMATVAFGVFRVLDGNMTIGALVACMILVWRVLGPLQMTFVSLARLTQVKSSVSQINALMNMKVEREPDKTVLPLPRFDGYISFARVSMRYSPETDPALVGVSFEVEPGEVVCVIGGNGSGKSTLIKVLAGMYFPQAGNIRIDQQDLRQLDLIEVRHAISYVPQMIQLFYGTIAQNLRLTRPTASDEELKWAAQEAGVLDEILALEQGSGKWKRTGFDVRVGDGTGGQMPTSFLQRLNLTRGYIKRSSIMLFDEPGNGLDYEGDQAFMRKVEKLRGNTTVFIVTHRPSHLKLADKIIWMEAGHLKAFGPAEAVLQQIPKNFL
ncbi:MAG: ATP-binding cassette domain-containing protein [Rhodospirillales bacterium]|jgi:ATP-binding cassette, subfamily C, bacterial LapB|nr:ATP-binding cassette domain-containing protein [Rhodospirillales bacterium]